MSGTFPLPPSERDFEVFFNVAFRSISTRATAEQHKISQTRVRQIATLVGDWLAEHLPEWSEADLQKQVRLAQHVAAAKLEHQYAAAMRLWEVEADPKHLRQATRIAAAQARLGIVAGRLEALAADATVGPAELGEEARTEDPTNQSEVAADSSPVRDCSPAAAARGNERASAGDDAAASDCPAMLVERERRTRQEAVEEVSLVENRLLSLIGQEGDSAKVAELNVVLSRVRQHKASAELRLSRFLPGVQIEPLAVPIEAAETPELAVSANSLPGSSLVTH